MSYWETIKRGTCDYVNNFHFCDDIHLGTIRIEILKTQVFVFNKLLEDPTLIEDDDFTGWACCAPSETMNQILELCVSVFNNSFRDKFSELLQTRSNELLTIQNN